MARSANIKANQNNATLRATFYSKHWLPTVWHSRLSLHSARIMVMQRIKNYAHVLFIAVFQWTWPVGLTEGCSVFPHGSWGYFFHPFSSLRSSLSRLVEIRLCIDGLIECAPSACIVTFNESKWNLHGGIRYTFPPSLFSRSFLIYIY